MKFDQWGTNLMNSKTDYSGFEGVRLLFELSRANDPKYLEDVQAKVNKVRSMGKKLMLCIDFHVRSPYHGIPPHVDLITEPDGSQTTKITKDDKRRNEGLGLTPMSWTYGWKWARTRISEVAEWFDPEFIQMTERPDIRTGWPFGAKPEAGFKDMMRIYQQGLIEDADWAGGFVIPHTPSIPAIEKEGLKKAASRWDNDAKEEMRSFSGVSKESEFNWAVAVPTNGDTEPPDDIPPDDTANKMWLKLQDAMDILEEISAYLEDLP